MEDDQKCIVEGIASALVKEFLHQKGCHKTLERFRLEMPCNGVPISNRKTLVKTLELQDLYNKNKARTSPYGTVLEIITENILYKGTLCKSEAEPLPTTLCTVPTIATWVTPRNSDDLFLQTKSASSGYLSHKIQDIIDTEESSVQVDENIYSEENSLFHNSSEVHQVLKPVSNASSPNPRERRRIRSTEELNHKVYADSDIDGESQSKSFTWKIIDSLGSVGTRTSPKGLHQVIKEVTHPTKMNFYNSSYRLPHEVSSSVRLLSPDNYSCVRPINVDEACELRILLFGNTKRTFGKEWSEQGFSFCDSSPITYGISQKRAGPCGVLAAVQAHLICEMLFGNMNVQLSSRYLRPTVQERREALARALTRILWQAGEGKQVIFAVKSDHMVLSVDVVPTLLEGDGVVEYLNLRVFESEEYLLEYLFNIIPELEDDESGSCVTFLYSVLLTRGIENIREDMDNPESHLIGMDGYASQEIVNLLLIGRAVSNVFDGDKVLNSDGPDRMILHGIPTSSKIGQLSLYEYHNTCRVGKFYKDPRHPIWLVLSESHFTVLFGTSIDVFERELLGGSFKLFIYDGLSKERKERCITLEPAGGRELVPGTDDDYLPALERCIHTRWKKATIKWES